MGRFEILDEELEEINRELQEVEFLLRELDCGIGAEVQLGDRVNAVLGYGKIGKKWILYVKTPHTEAKDIIETGRVTKAIAISRLPALLDELLKRSEALDEVVDDPVLTVRSFREKLEELAHVSKEEEEG